MPGFILDTAEQLTIFNHNIRHSISEYSPGSDRYRIVPLITHPSQDAREKNMRWIKHFFWKRTMKERVA